MAYTHLLDTNIISDLVRNPTGAVYQQIASVGEANVCTSIVVACELRFGVRKSGSLRLQQQLGQILELLTVLPFDAPADAHYAEIRTRLEQQGTPIGPNDLLIAAHALAQNVTLVSADLREFERVPDLQVVNWI